MSYHILHQFDEQWLADLAQETDGKRRENLLDSLDDKPQQVRHTRLSTRDFKRRVIVAVGVLMAAFALLFAVEASRRAESLQQRVDALEQTVRK
jgi:hypothetical protein